mgnify:CR=1 FL=1
MISSVRKALSGFKRAAASGLFLGSLAIALTGCTSATLDDLGVATPKIPAALLKEMQKKGMTAESPVLVRIFKEESVLEVWKQDRSGRYALLKSYPMCRWSGKLGPKTKSGDRQAPEGFYHVSKGMLNPKSQYYLSFNLGYPNRLESALGYTGEALMVHGACSSSGCYAMTDQGVGEIYSLVQKALDGGQDRFQVQAFPFRMTARKLVAHRDDPNFSFWRTLKQGYDSFETTRQQPKVSVCGRRYVFDTSFGDGEPRSPLADCPAAGVVDPRVAAAWSTQTKEIDKLLTEETENHAMSYVDGGMHPSFRALLKENGPEKLASRISQTSYPISRPAAALADPFNGEKLPKTP